MASKSDTSFVRHEMLTAKAPPASTTGVLGWMRENLFSSISNSIMTLLGLYLVYAIVSWMVPWVFVPTWGGTSQIQRLITGS